MQNMSEKFGIRLRECRISRGLSQEQLALRANINVSFLGQIERGTKKPTIDTIDKLLSALDITFTSFFDFETPAANDVGSEIVDKIVYELQGRDSDEQQLIYDIIRRILIYIDLRSR